MGGGVWSPVCVCVCVAAVAVGVAAVPAPDLADASGHLSDTLSSLLPNLVDDGASARCLQPVVVGDCRATLRRWAFDRRTRRCRDFPWSGCGGSDNLFLTEDLCRSTCGSLLGDSDSDSDSEQRLCPAVDNCAGSCRVRTNKTSGCPECTCKDESPPAGACRLRPETGLCKGAFRRFAFDPESGRCAEFIWGGCGGNDNNFKSEEQCLRTCA